MSILWHKTKHCIDSAKQNGGTTGNKQNAKEKHSSFLFLNDINNSRWRKNYQTHHTHQSTLFLLLLLFLIGNREKATKKQTTHTHPPKRMSWGCMCVCDEQVAVYGGYALMCMHAYACMRTCVCVCVCARTRMCVCVCVFVRVHVSVFYIYFQCCFTGKKTRLRWNGTKPVNKAHTQKNTFFLFNRKFRES